MDSQKDIVKQIKESEAYRALINALDKNGDSKFSIEDAIILTLKIPGIYVNRADFMQNEYRTRFPQHVIDKAIKSTPAQAGISINTTNKIADDVIKYERLYVSGISAALGIPGGAAIAATVPVDFIQYFGYTLRATQKLLYLYGFPDIDSESTKGLQLDSATLHELVLCIGVMNTVEGANNAIKAVARALASGVEKKLLNKALTKGVVFPAVKAVLKWFNVNLTKKVFAGAAKKFIPLLGALIGGGITFFAFKPCCERLKIVLQDTILSNPNHVADKYELEISEEIYKGDYIDVDYSDIPEEEQD